MTSCSERERDGAIRWAHSLALPALLVLFLGAACTSMRTKLEPPVVTLESVRILSVADAKANVSLVLRLSNPNRIDLAVETIEYEVTLDGRPAASGRSARIEVVPAQGDATVELTGRVDVAAVATALMTLGSQLPVEYAFKGSATLRDGTVLTLSRKGEIPVARFDRRFGARPQ